jgi:hypothetical protein
MTYMQQALDEAKSLAKEGKVEEAFDIVSNALVALENRISRIEGMMGPIGGSFRTSP